MGSWHWPSSCSLLRGGGHDRGGGWWGSWLHRPGQHGRGDVGDEDDLLDGVLVDGGGGEGHLVLDEGGDLGGDADPADVRIAADLDDGVLVAHVVDEPLVDLAGEAPHGLLGHGGAGAAAEVEP